MFRTLVIPALAALAIAGPALSETPREISWDQLVPAGEPIVDPLEGVAEDIIFDLGFINRMKSDLRLGFISETSPDYLKALEVQKALADKGIDFEKLMADLEAVDEQIAKMGREVVTDLDGRSVRIPGYVLPLEQSEDGVSEFLLVPYIGACIHTPPPPANQMVFVTLADEYRVRTLYEPVWVSGRMGIQAATRSLSYVDGEAPIETGYTLEGLLVEPYE